MKEEIITIAILTKLLPTNIVASSFSGAERSFNANNEELFLLSLSSSNSLGSKEKKATSEPEISAEMISNKTRTRSPIRASGLKG
jgi:hypothetical protein